MQHDVQNHINITRGTCIESLHQVHIAVVNAGHRLLYSIGNPQLITYARSTAKLLQAIPVVESGASARFSMTPKEIALCTASHSGESTHVAAVESLLKKAGKSVHDLKCGPHYPLHKQSAQDMMAKGTMPTSIHNTCSGKHAGMLILAAHMGLSAADYHLPDHPVQKIMRDTVAEMCGIHVSDMPLGIDGCGVPVFAMSIDRLALAFAKFGTGTSLTAARAKACQTIINAIAENPYYIAGSQRFDTALIEVTHGRWIGKMGAEGLFAAVCPDLGLSFVVKIQDGSERALYPAVMETLLQLGALQESEYAALSQFHMPDVKNWRGDTVGSITPIFKLYKHN